MEELASLDRVALAEGYMEFVYSGNLENHLEIRRLQELKGVPDNSPGGELCLS